MLARKKARDLIRKFRTNNPFEIIKGLNVILVFFPLDGVRGFYQHFQRNNIIYIDERLSDEEKKFVCAHELGHMLLHKKTNALFMNSRTNLNTAKYEKEADKFAVELLISDKEIEDNKDFTVEQISRLLGYHQKIIELKIK